MPADFQWLGGYYEENGASLCEKDYNIRSFINIFQKKGL